MRAAISHRMDSAFQSTLPTRGSDPFLSPSPFWVFIFQSTLPTRGSDGEPPADMLALYKFQSTLPTRGSDARRLPLCYSPLYFNPRSPRGGATFFRFCPKSRAAFQSTLPTRGSDKYFAGPIPRGVGFNPRYPRGGATEAQGYIVHHKQISIHAPHEGERPSQFSSYTPAGNLFQSTLPTRGSDLHIRSIQKGSPAISIHAPRKGERRLCLAACG